MKKAVFLLSLLSICAIASAASWTVMVFLDGDNNLEAYAVDDFMEMAKTGSDTFLNILVQFDRRPSYSTAYGDWTDCWRFKVEKDMTPETSNAEMGLGEVNMADPQSLIDFFEWGVDNYPADRYLFVIWDHGTGWFKTAVSRNGGDDSKAVLQDDTSMDFLYYTEGDVTAALNGMYSYLGRKLDIIGFDVCFNQMAENLNYITPFADYVIGSEDTVWGDGWSYWYFLDYIRANAGNVDAEEVAQKIIEAYSQGDNGDNTSNPIITGRTMSAVDSTAFGEVKSAMNRFAVMAGHYYHNGYSQKLNDAYDGALKYYVSANALNIDLIDYLTLIKAYSIPDDLFYSIQALIGSVEGAVISNFSYDSRSFGIAAYFPEAAYYNEYYEENLFASDTFWNEYIKHTEPWQGFTLISTDLDDGDTDGILEQGESFLCTMTLRNDSNFKIDTVTAAVSEVYDFSDISAEILTRSDVRDKDTFTLTVAGTVNAAYTGFGTERLRIDLSTGYFDFSETLYAYLNIGEPIVLLVDDDDGDTFEQIISEALSERYINHTVYDIRSSGDTFPGTLLDGFRHVVWNTGIKGSEKLFERGEISLIEDFLDAGGNILISSRYLLKNFDAVDSPEIREFSSDYLGIAGFAKLEFANEENLFGIFKDPVTEGLAVTLSDPAYELSIYRTNPVDNAVHIFQNISGSKIGIRNPRYSEDLGFKSIFCPFSIERITDPLAEFLERAIAWFAGLTDEYHFDPDDALAYPNPVVKGGEVRFIELDGQGIIRIYDAAGVLVRTLPKNGHIWDLKNEDGRTVKSGIYFYTVEKYGGVTFTGKIAVIR